MSGVWCILTDVFGIPYIVQRNPITQGRMLKIETMNLGRRISPKYYPV